MANFRKAIDYLFSNETFTRNGSIVSHYENPATGEISNWGISLVWLRTVDPEATADTVRNLTREAAEQLYQKYWWEENRICNIPSDDIATKVLDMCVNCGAGTGIKILQDTLNMVLTPAKWLVPDGVIGPHVIACITEECAGSPEIQMLLTDLSRNLCKHYRDIAAKDPAKHAADLPGWLARAGKLPGTVS